MDSIGPFTFVKLERAPDRTSRQWEIVARAGVHGVSMWDLGERGEPFTLTSQAVAITYAAGRAFLANYKSLEWAAPVEVYFGTIEAGQLYKVLRVQPEGPGVKRVVRAHVANDPITYQALVFARWLLLPINPFVQRP